MCLCNGTLIVITIEMEKEQNQNYVQKGYPRQELRRSAFCSCLEELTVTCELWQIELGKASNKKNVQLDLGISVSTCAGDQVRIGYAALRGLHKG